MFFFHGFDTILGTGFLSITPTAPSEIIREWTPVLSQHLGFKGSCLTRPDSGCIDAPLALGRRMGRG